MRSMNILRHILKIETHLKIEFAQPSRINILLILEYAYHSKNRHIPKNSLQTPPSEGA